MQSPPFPTAHRPTDVALLDAVEAAVARVADVSSAIELLAGAVHDLGERVDRLAGRLDSLSTEVGMIGQHLAARSGVKHLRAVDRPERA